MVEAHSINAEHKDLIHDVAFDYYGERMATCSTDQFVKVSVIFLTIYVLKCIIFLILLNVGLGPRWTR